MRSQTNQTWTQNIASPINTLLASWSGNRRCCRWGHVGAAQAMQRTCFIRRTAQHTAAVCDTLHTAAVAIHVVPASHATRASKNCFRADHRVSCSPGSQPSASSRLPACQPEIGLVPSPSPSPCQACPVRPAGILPGSFAGQVLEHRRIAARCTVCGHHRIPHQPILSTARPQIEQQGGGDQLAG